MCPVEAFVEVCTRGRPPRLKPSRGIMDERAGWCGWAVLLLLMGCAGAHPPRPAPVVVASPVTVPAPAAPSPEAAQVHVRLGIDDLLNGNRERARDQFQGALAIVPEHPVAGRLLGLIEADDPVAARAAALRGVDLLNRGDAAQARDVLIEALCSEPDNELARNLLAQLDADPRQVLGDRAFDYTVQPGESLSRIAQRFMGDRFKFHLLARYNGIDNPSRLRAGQVIQVPGDAPASVAAPAPEPDITPPLLQATPAGGEWQGSVTVILTAEDARDPAPAVYYTLDGSPPRVADSQRYREPLTVYETTTVQGVAVDRAGNLSSPIRETYHVQPPPTPIAPAASPTQLPPGTPLAELYQQGLSAVERGDREAAVALFDQVLAREPGHSGALQARQRVVAEGVDDWYRQAYAALRRQRPRETVTYCDRVLAVAPEHRNAQVLRMQALDLIQRLVAVDLGEARAALQRGDAAEAGRYARRVLEQDPHNREAQKLLHPAQPRPE